MYHKVLTDQFIISLEYILQSISISTSIFDAINKSAYLFSDQVIELEKCSVIWFHEFQRKFVLNDVMAIEYNNWLNEVKNYSMS